MYCAQLQHLSQLDELYVTARHSASTFVNEENDEFCVSLQ